MEGSQAGPPPGLPPQQPVAQALLPDDQRPATAEDVKGLRRWAIVAGVWAVAATALAVMALLKPAPDEGPDPAAAANRSINRLEGRLGGRFQRLEDRVGLLPNAADLQKLDTRTQRVESRAGQAAGDAGAARDSIGKLQDRVEKVEQTQKRQSSSPDGAGAGSGGGAGPGASGGRPRN
ncbi:MAG: hypothetical protein M3350_02725 [Actinomycetota bacterium]|nr:hypothetical protein [Actinomycetota bacterium]MDQ3719685.1 hypothetical protein [Actinomycetota bacterium]